MTKQKALSPCPKDSEIVVFWCLDEPANAIFEVPALILVSGIESRR